MNSTYFTAVKNGNVIGDGTVADLMDWIGRYVNILFPENGIEYWSDQKRGGPNDLKSYQPAPAGKTDLSQVHHFACYVHAGSCEGHFLEIASKLRDGTMVRIGNAKSLRGADECWSMARAIDEALNSIYFYREIPEIVEMADKVPRQPNWKYEACRKEAITIFHTPCTLQVVMAGGRVLDDRNWTFEADNAHFYMEPRLQTWKKVLTNLQATFSCTTASRLVVSDLPNYLTSSPT